MDHKRMSAITLPIGDGRWNGYSIAADVLTFVVAAAGSFVVHVVGDLPVADLVLLPLLPFLIGFNARRLLRPSFRPIFVLLLLWLAAQIVTDVYRGTEAIDWMRGDARILFITIDFVGLALLVGKSVRRHVLFLAGYAVGSMLVVRLQPNEYTDFWKFGYAQGVTLSVVLLSCYFFTRRKYAVVVLLLMVLACVHMAFNFRSPILYLFITIILVTPVIPERIGELRLLPAAGSKMRLLVLVVMALSAGQSAGSLVVFLGSHGVLGEDAKEKNDAEANVKGGLLIGGRPEILISSRAVMDSPILGHGSLARDFKYTEEFNDIQVEYGRIDDKQAAEEDETGSIPSHSHLMGAWVYAGVFGGLFWGYILFLTLKGLIRTAITQPPLAPIYIFTLLTFVWNILFSPAGSVTILLDTFMMNLICTLLESPAPSRPQLQLRSRGRNFDNTRFRASFHAL